MATANQKIELVKGGRKIDGQFVPNTPKDTPTALTSSTLTPAAPFTLTQPKPSTQADGLAGYIESTASTFQESLQAKADAAQTQSKTSLDSYLASLASAQGQTALTDAAYRDTVDPAEAELSDINNQILAEQHSLRRRLEAIDKAGGGLSSGAQAEKSNITRDSISKQADLAVIQMARQGKYDSAKAIADRAVAAKFEQQRNTLEALRFNYEENKDLFDTAEQRAFEVMLGERNRALDMDEFKEKSRFEQTIRENDPLYKAQLSGQYTSNAKNAAELSILNAKQKQIEDAVASGVVMLDKDQQDTAMKLGKQFEDESKTFKTQVDAYNRVLASAEDPSAAGDLSLIYGYMKMLDPGSVVRETEFATAQNAAGVPEVIRAKWNQALRGERLSEVTRADFIDRAATIYSSALDQQIDLEDTYSQQGTSVYGLPKEAVDLIVRDIRSQGAVSDVAFGLTLNNLSDDQLAELVKEGLMSTPNNR